MKKILWASRYQPLPSQRKELQRLFGQDVQIDVKDDLISTVEIIRTFREGFYDELVLISPVSVCHKIVGYGFKPLYAEMKMVTPEESEVQITNPRRPGTRHYKFVQFKRVERVELILSDL